MAIDVVQLEQWFRAADEDRDGVIGGAEAVKFFQRSGLAQEVLGQVREAMICPECPLGQMLRTARTAAPRCLWSQCAWRGAARWLSAAAIVPLELAFRQQRAPWRTPEHRWALHGRLTAISPSQIWDLSSSGAASLNKVQFSTAIRLVSLAQVRAGQTSGPGCMRPRLRGTHDACCASAAFDACEYAQQARGRRAHAAPAQPPPGRLAGGPPARPTRALVPRGVDVIC